MAVVDALPVELLVLCFVPLSFRDRVRLSYVSRRWRVIALGHAELCNRLEFHHNPKHSATFLAALERARTLPLEVTWEFRSSESAGFDLLEAQLPRVRAMSVRMPHWMNEDDELPKRLLVRRFPPLEEVCIDSLDIFTIPEQWSNLGAPKLREITVSHFTFHPTSGPFHALRRLTANLDPYAHAQPDPRRIFELCPALLELELRCVGRETLQCL
ncbi:hypothetical protein AURDEDRAFT_116501, partial [Auricularia subglabra TFB-10046 SS5]